MSDWRVLGIIPARAGSRGLPGKNIRPLGGLPLVAHSIAAATRVPAVSRCVVSTDSEEIAAIARVHGGDVPFLRPAELARDDTPMAPVIRHALEEVEREEGMAYDAVLLLDPTSPVRLPEQLSLAVSRLAEDPSLDGVISVSKPVFNPLWVGVRDDGTGTGVLARYMDAGKGIIRRQDAGEFLRINGNFYAWRTGFVRRLDRSWFDEGRHSGFVIPESQAYSIDDESEFRVLAALLAAGLVRLPWLDPRPARRRTVDAADV